MSDLPDLTTALTRVNETQSLVRVRQIALGEALTRLRSGNLMHGYIEAQERLSEANEEHFEALAVVDQTMERMAEESNRRAA